jgi:ABC-type multidrug transport system permease subunit
MKMSLPSWKISLRVFGWLLWFDVRFLWKDFFQNIIDAIAWPTAIIVSNGYVVQQLGMDANYGGFITVSMIVIMGAYSAWTTASTIVADLAGPQTISYELTLPVPYWMVWLKNGLYLSIKAAVFNVIPLFIGKIALGNRFNLSNFSLFYFVLIYTASALFFGMFALWSTVLVKDMESHSRLDLRLVGPMFYFNGFTASWAVMYAASKWIGIGVLFTPWIYIYEGNRAAILGQTGYLPFWVCYGMILLFSAVTTWWSIRLFKKRMDCV